MKNLILCLLVTLCLTVACNEAKAQITLYKSTSTIAGITTQKNDSVTNTETTYFSTRRGDLASKEYTKYRVSWKCDTTSGTPTTINVVLQGSIDGSKWFNFSGVGLGVDGVNCDTLTQTTAANEYFTITSIVGGTKFANGATRGNGGMKCNYMRLMIVAASGTHNTVFSDVKLITAE